MITLALLSDREERMSHGRVGLRLEKLTGRRSGLLVHVHGFELRCLEHGGTPYRWEAGYARQNNLQSEQISLCKTFLNQCEIMWAIQIKTTKHLI